jgi:hypothetical protein
MLRKEPRYVDNLYSQYHVQYGSEELLLPIQPQNISPAYPTALSGLVTHVEEKPSVPPFHPSHFLSVPVNKKLVNVVEQRKVRSAPSAPRVLSDMAPPGSSLYEATYSGVEVYELVIGDSGVMRRRDDSWVNATHILKVKQIHPGGRYRKRKTNKDIGERVGE